MKDIHNAKQLREMVLSILEKHSEEYQGSLEEYLRSLWTVIQEKKSQEPSYLLFVEMLENAFTNPPAEFDAQWLDYKEPLHWNYREDTHVLEALKGKKLIIVERDIDPFRILKHTILFQIADLYRMRENQLKNEFRYLGVQSPTGNTWYNFDISTYLKCSMSGIGGYDEDRENEFFKCEWSDLAGLLTLGRLYE